MNALLASLGAAAGAAAGVIAIGQGPGRSPVARAGLVPVPESGEAPTFSVMATWPGFRRIPLSGRTRERLDLAGLPGREADVISAKVLLTAIVALPCLVVAPIVAAPAAVLAYRVPDLVVARLARRRLERADREIPVLLDLLAVATSAGLPPQLAFRRAVDAAEGPLAEELRPVLNATDLGGRWGDELGAVSERLGLPDLRRVVAALTRAQALGSSLADEISRLASDVRERRRTAATERARAAPVKMLFPLVFLVLPAFLLLTVVPVLVTTVQSIR